MKKFHYILDSAIEFKGIPQKKIAKDLHINPTTLNNYIKGKREPDLETIINLMMYLDIDLYDFFTNNSGNQDYAITRDEATLLNLYRSSSDANKEKIIEIAKIINK